jgi:hypothetical protein
MLWIGAIEATAPGWAPWPPSATGHVAGNGASSECLSPSSINGGKARPIRLLLNTGRRRHGDHGRAGIVRPAPGSVLYSVSTPTRSTMVAPRVLRRSPQMRSVTTTQQPSTTPERLDSLSSASRRRSKKAEQDGTRNQRTKVFPPNTYKDIPAVVEAMPRMPTLRLTGHW